MLQNQPIPKNIQKLKHQQQMILPITIPLAPNHTTLPQPILKNIFQKILKPSKLLIINILPISV